MKDTDKHLLAWIIIEGLKQLNLSMTEEQKETLERLARVRHLDNMNYIAEAVLKSKIEREQLQNEGSAI